ncbi:MAG: single-stranded DNA-binding protein [Ferruginibacter sp.]
MNEYTFVMCMKRMVHPRYLFLTALPVKGWAQILKAMYALKNKVQLIGNLGNAPEVKNTEGGKKLVRFSVATNESYRNANGERVKQTQWHNVIAWGTVADVVEKYLVKGSEIALEGKLIYRNYTDKEGQKKYVTEIQMNEMLMLGSKQSV